MLVAVLSNRKKVIGSTSQGLESERKRTRLISNTSQEIVGLEYSVLPTIHTLGEERHQTPCCIKEMMGDTRETAEPKGKARLGKCNPEILSNLAAGDDRESGRDAEMDVTKARFKRMLAPHWCPAALSKTQRRRLQKFVMPTVGGMTRTPT
jgi:hypothetical protein